jgi:hypothetical protein
MIERLLGPLPVWAQADHPILRQRLRPIPLTPRARVLRAVAVVVLLLAMGTGGYLYATDFFATPPGQNLSETVNRIAFYPLVLLHLLGGLVAFSLTAGTVGEEQRAQTWDTLRTTPDGAALVLRSRWVSVFYRLAPVLTGVVLVRALLVMATLWDLTAFRGQYLDLLMGGIIPDIPVAWATPVGTLLLASSMTAVLIIPLTTVAFEAALGLLLSAYIRQRSLSIVFQVLLLLARVAVTFGLLTAALGFYNNTVPLASEALPLAWLTLFAFSALTDGGVRMIHLAFAGEMWVMIPYGLFIGFGVFVFVLAQVVLAQGILHLAERAATRRE